MQVPVSYLELGLTALAHAGQKSMFTGHYGAVLLAAYFMDVENDLPEYVQAGLINNCEHLIQSHTQFFMPFPEQVQDQKLLDEVVKAIRINLRALRSSGHGVILGVLALKALIKQPDLCVPAIIDGISQTVKNAASDGSNRYYGIDDYHSLTSDDIFGIPAYQSIADVIEIALAECEFAAPDRKIDNIYYHFTGELEHGVTFAHALAELERLGYQQLAILGMETHRLQMHCNRLRPAAVLRDIITDPNMSSITDRGYWAKIYDDPHSIKVPYAALALLKHLSDAKRTRAEANICKLLSQMK